LNYKQNCASKILQTKTDGKCRLCQQISRDNRPHYVSMPSTGKRIIQETWQCVQLHFNIRKETGKTKDQWCEHLPKWVETSQDGWLTILWNQQVQTDRTIPNNKPDIIIRGNEKGTWMLIYVAIAGDRNVIQKEAEKIVKYKDLV
jgi:hypothetical protein